MALTKGRVRTLIFFLTPAFLLIILFYIIPLFLSVYISFTPLKLWNLKTYLSKVTTDNYRRLFHIMIYDPDVSKIVKTTIVFVAFTLFINVVGGLVLAIATFVIDEFISLPFRTLWMLPRMTPIAVYSLLWYYFFLGDPQGTLNSILLRLGVIDKAVAWGVDPSLLPYSAWAILIIVNGLVGVSFGMIIFYSAFKSIPREQIVAARVDGANTWQVIRHILIPQIRWHIMYVTVWELLSLSTTYAHIYLLVKWGAVDKFWGSTWALFVFNTAFETGDQGLAAAAATILVALGLVLGFIALRLLGYKRMVGEPRGDL